MIYRLYSSNPYNKIVDAVMTVDQTPASSFFFDPDNTDYQQFKININKDSAQLENADGVLMSAEDAKAYVATLP